MDHRRCHPLSSRQPGNLLHSSDSGATVKRRLKRASLLLPYLAIPPPTASGAISIPSAKRRSFRKIPLPRWTDFQSFHEGCQHPSYIVGMLSRRDGSYATAFSTAVFWLQSKNRPRGWSILRMQPTVDTHDIGCHRQRETNTKRHKHNQLKTAPHTTKDKNFPTHSRW